MSLSTRSLLVTVGTTEFDQLIQAIDNTDFAVALQNLLINKVTIQMGRGVHEPNVLLQACRSLGIETDLYRYKPDLEVEMKVADLIISHCGAGSILEAVKYKKPLIVVVNETLQDNHQTELSDAMSSSGYCVSTVPKDLLRTLVTEFSRTESSIERSNRRAAVKNIPINDPSLFCKVLDSMFEFSS